MMARPSTWLVSVALSLLARLSFGAVPATSAAAVDAQGPAGAAAPAPAADPWPVAVIERPQTLPAGMAAASLISESYWSPGAHEHSYFGPAATLAIHDRVQIAGGLPSALCWDDGSNACVGASTLDRAFVDLTFALRRRESSWLAGGVTESIEHFRDPSEHRTTIWLTGRRAWFHRLALVGSAALGIGWEHTLTVSPSRPGPVQSNQTRVYWTEEMIWQVVDRFALFAYGNPYRPLGAPGDESFATRAGGGATLAIGPRWLFAVDCSVDNIMPARQWQYVPNAKGCVVSASVYRLPH
jgi:hypothetical protein